MPTRRRTMQAILAGGMVAVAGCPGTGSGTREKPDIVDVLMSTTEIVPPGEGPNGKAGVRVTMTNTHDDVTVSAASFEVFGRHESDASAEVFNATVALDEPLAPDQQATWFIPLDNSTHDRLGAVGWSPESSSLSWETPSE